MVLSRKKLKEKLRNLLADTESKNNAINGKEDIVKLVESVKERLKESKLKRPRPSRPKRKKKPNLGGEEGKEKKKEGGTEEKWDEAPETEKGSSEKKVVKKEKKKKEKKKNKKKDKKEESNNEEKEKVVVKKEALETATGVKNSSSEQKAPESNSSIKLAESEDNAKKVYVGGIPYYSTEDDIKSFFEGCGTVTNIDCMKFPETGKFRGIAILTFKTESAAKRAISLDGSDMGGFYLKIQPYKRKGASKPDFSPQTVEGYNRIYIGNLSWDITEDDLKSFFKRCKISSIRFGTDKSTGDFKGYAHVDFEDGNSLAIALKLDQEVVRGRPVRIQYAVPRRASEAGNNSVNKASDAGNAITEGEERETTVEEGEVHKKQKRRTCYKCGTPGHLSSACPNKKINADSKNTNMQEVVNKFSQEEPVDTTQEVHKKQKRRTCYECGTPGHLSSACPNKEINADSNNTSMGMNKLREEEPVDATQDGSVRKKQKCRTCYECGTPGHLSSDCPNKKTVVDGNATILHQEIQHDDSYKIREAEQVVDTQEGSVRKKQKCRTCYECGTPGHLSSDCPNKKTVVDGNATILHQEIQHDDSYKIREAEQVVDTQEGSVRKKKKRRTCYECGTPGHLSSECPNKTS